MPIKRGVSFYSYQQSQFLGQLDLEAQIREVGENLPGANGIELLDEQSLRYPEPPRSFYRQWFDWLDRYGAVPTTLDVFWDVLQFRDHVMDQHEGAQRLVHDIGLANRLGFDTVRVLSTHPVEVMIEALPVAEALDIRIVKEIHQPMPLDGPWVQEIAAHVERTGTKHLGVLIDCGVFQFRPCQPLLDWYVRRGAQREACDLVVQLSLDAHAGRETPLSAVDMSQHTAGNVRAEFLRFLNGEAVEDDLREPYQLMRQLVDEGVERPGRFDYLVFAEALNFSRTSADNLAAIAPLVHGVHGKFYEMTEVPGTPDTYEDVSIDYETLIDALTAIDYDGYVNSEYEGQRFFQDHGVEELEDEIEQVRRHQEMLGRLTAGREEDGER
jgi:sugar phosphate isomerase/epimerase